MGVWEAASPGGDPRVGILRFETTRGDRLFVSLLGCAFICLGWLSGRTCRSGRADRLRGLLSFCVFRLV